MARTSDAESLHISLSDDVATVQLVDSTRAVVQLPAEVMYRSTLLHQAITDASNSSEVCLMLPKGVLDAWLEGLKVLGIGARCPDMEPASKLPKRCPRSVRHFEDLQVRFGAFTDIYS